MHTVIFVFEALVAIFSMLAGIFWMSAAYGHTIGYPWEETRRVPLAGLLEHQAKWNGRAAVCASIAATCQALSFLFEHYVPIMMTAY